jgi:hypothetical protein
MMEKREEFHTLVTDGDSDLAEEARRMTAQKLMEAFPADIEMRRKLTPSFHPGCKRVILSDDYFPALARANCSLETRRINRISKTGIEVVDSVEGDNKTAIETEDFDLIVLSTGFRAVDFLHPITVQGPKGRSLEEVWAGGTKALYGVTVESMPNFAMLYGPNTNLSHNSLILMIETQSRYISTLISAVQTARNKGEILSITPRKDRVDKFNAQIQSSLAKTSFADQRCTSWFKNVEGTITTNWHGTAVDYQQLMSKVDWDDYELEGPAASELKTRRTMEIGRVAEEKQIGTLISIVGLVAAVGACFGLIVRTYSVSGIHF